MANSDIVTIDELEEVASHVRDFFERLKTLASSIDHDHTLRAAIDAVRALVDDVEAFAPGAAADPPTPAVSSSPRPVMAVMAVTTKRATAAAPPTRISPAPVVAPEAAPIVAAPAPAVSATPPQAVPAAPFVLAAPVDVAAPAEARSGSPAAVQATSVEVEPVLFIEEPRHNTTTEFAVLEFIRTSSRPVKFGQLIDTFNATANHINYRLQRLRAAGLIEASGERPHMLYRAIKGASSATDSSLADDVDGVDSVDGVAGAFDVNPLAGVADSAVVAAVADPGLAPAAARATPSMPVPSSSLPSNLPANSGASSAPVSATPHDSRSPSPPPSRVTSSPAARPFGRSDERWRDEGASAARPPARPYPSSSSSASSGSGSMFRSGAPELRRPTRMMNRTIVEERNPVGQPTPSVPDGPREEISSCRNATPALLGVLEPDELAAFEAAARRSLKRAQEELKRRSAEHKPLWKARRRLARRRLAAIENERARRVAKKNDGRPTSASQR